MAQCRKTAGSPVRQLISPGIFGGGFEDVTAISHEIAETFDDPFVNNITPRWQFPGDPAYARETWKLETRWKSWRMQRSR